MRQRSPKSNHFFALSHWYFCASLVKIRILVQAIECRQGSFFNSLYSVMNLKISSRSPISNQSFNYANGTIHNTWLLGQNPSIGSRDRSADKAHFSVYSVMTLKIRSRSSKSNKIF